jgi:hypothetical protein
MKMKRVKSQEQEIPKNADIRYIEYCLMSKGTHPSTLHPD